MGTLIDSLADAAGAASSISKEQQAFDEEFAIAAITVSNCSSVESKEASGRPKPNATWITMTGCRGAVRSGVAGHARLVGCRPKHRRSHDLADCRAVSIDFAVRRDLRIFPASQTHAATLVNYGRFRPSSR